MKLIIDISKDRYDEIMSMDWKNCRLIFDEEIRAIHDGKALEQEPCEDAVSRQAVNELVDELARAISDERSCISRGRSTATIMRDILHLPSVTPQPCEDCVSRDMVLDLVADYDLSMGQVVKGIHALPSVSPQQKVGYWEWNQYDANPKIGNFHCSLCHSIGRTYFDYCPYCGAKMSEIPTGAEGSDKE